MKSAELACRFCGQPVVFRIDDNNAYQAADDIHTDFLQHILQRKHVCVYRKCRSCNGTFTKDCCWQCGTRAATWADGKHNDVWEEEYLVIMAKSFRDKFMVHCSVCHESFSSPGPFLHCCKVARRWKRW